ncbi:MAG: hypothetical protein ACHWZW_10060 [Spirulina sp.]
MRIPMQSKASLRKDVLTSRINTLRGLLPQEEFSIEEIEEFLPRQQLSIEEIEEAAAGQRVKPGGGRIARFLWCRFGPEGGSRDDCAKRANQ